MDVRNAVTRDGNAGRRFQNNLRRDVFGRIVPANGRPRRDQGRPGEPQDIDRRLDFTFCTDAADALLKAFGILRRDLPRRV